MKSENPFAAPSTSRAHFYLLRLGHRRRALKRESFMFGLGMLFASIAIAVLTACSADPLKTETGIFALPEGATITVTDLRDECLDDATDCAYADGDCSIREAINAARGDRNTSALRDACTAGMGSGYRDVIVIPLGLGGSAVNGLTGTTTLTGSALDDSNLGGDLDVAWYDIEIRGPDSTYCNADNKRGCWHLNANNLDRGIHAADSTSQRDVRLSGIEVYNGCANGNYPTCATSSPFGGAIYANVGGSFIGDRLFLHDSRASNGGACFRTCAGDTTTANYQISNLEAYNCVGGPAVQTHVNGEWSDVHVHDNTTSVAGANGSFDVFSKTSTCTNCVIENNTNTNSSGAGYNVRGSSSTRSRLIVRGGSVTGNASNGDGAGVRLDGSCQQTPARTYGCSALLYDVTISGNTADSPTTSPSGNGGGVWISTAGTYPSRLELHGTTSVSSNTDQSSGTYGPDCYGTLYTYNSASVGNTTGCTVTPVQVCGNGTVESGEQCDDHNTNNGDCCSSTCQYESSSASCSDGDACTVGDHCNGSGACTSGTATPCGDGTVQASCGEACDDGNTASNDGCHANCQPETCTGWSYP